MDALQLEHVARDLNLSTSCVRLSRVRLFECLRFGFGIVFLSL